MNPLTIPTKQSTKKVLISSKKKTLKIDNSEHIISNNSKITSRVTTNGTIKFCNDDFSASFGFSKKDNFNDATHPDMPNIIFKIIDHNIEKEINSTFYIKNRNANGKFFWTLSNFNPNKSNDMNIAFTLSSKKAHSESVYQINKLYSRLNQIEKTSGESQALKYLIGFLEEKNISFSEYNSQLATIYTI